MNFTDRIRAYLSPSECLPAAGQGVLGIECRADDEATQALIAPLNHAITCAAVTAERATCRGFNGGCHVPVKLLMPKFIMKNSHYMRLLQIEMVNAFGVRNIQEY